MTKVLHDFVFVCALSCIMVIGVTNSESVNNRTVTINWLSELLSNSINIGKDINLDVLDRIFEYKGSYASKLLVKSNLESILQRATNITNEDYKAVQSKVIDCKENLPLSISEVLSKFEICQNSTVIEELRETYVDLYYIRNDNVLNMRHLYEKIVNSDEEMFSKINNELTESIKNIKRMMNIDRTTLLRILSLINDLDNCNCFEEILQEYNIVNKESSSDIIIQEEPLLLCLTAKLKY